MTFRTYTHKPGTEQPAITLHMSPNQLKDDIKRSFGKLLACGYPREPELLIVDLQKMMASKREARR